MPGGEPTPAQLQEKHSATQRQSGLWFCPLKLSLEGQDFKKQATVLGASIFQCPN